MKRICLLLTGALLALPLIAADYPLEAPTAKGGLPSGQTAENQPAPPLGEDENKDIKRERAYPEQPPTIPHSIRGYHIDGNSNKCLTCHSRTASARSQAPMISITHYMDRDGQALAAVAPRRYFCVQCHVPQRDVQPPVTNVFEDVDTLLQREAGTSTGKP